MKAYAGYEEAKAATGDFETLPVGGYICKIKAVTVTPAPEGKNYDELMTIDFDIAEGDSKGYFQRMFDGAVERNGITSAKWRGKIYQTIKEDLRFFKGFMTCIENSNTGFKWDWDEKKLVGKLFGGIFSEEEYEANDKSVKTSVKCSRQTSVDKIKSGDFKVPNIKRLAGYSAEKAAFEAMSTDTDDLPF